jgi:hypothetical protein
MEVQVALTEASECVVSDAALPGQVFRHHSAVRMIEWDLLWSRRFADFVIDLTKSSGSDAFRLLVLSPDPLEYFFHHFGSLPMLTLTSSDDSDAYIRAINRDPGNSPADAIVHNSNVIVGWPSSKRWCLYGDRDFEIALIALQQEELVARVAAAPVPTYSMDSALAMGLVRVERHDDIAELLTNYP